MPPWRNGSRNRFKICYPYGCVGSSPTGGTKITPKYKEGVIGD